MNLGLVLEFVGMVLGVGVASRERTRQINPGEEYAGYAREEMFSVL